MHPAPARGEPFASRVIHRRSTYAVWEITLKCNLACIHCGSRAGPARENELTTEEALDLVRQLDEIGIREVSLIGGEAFLRPDWLEIAQEITRRGMLCSMTTGGYGISLETARRMLAAGFVHVDVSVDGLEASHDRQRGKEGSWRQCFETMRHFREVGLSFGCNTQMNRLSAPELPTLYERIRDAGARSWQVQMTVPMGNAADNTWLIFQPCELEHLFPMLARVVARANAEGVSVFPANNVGYFSPFEHVLRAQLMRRGQMWMGCQAGLRGLGIEADGKIKGDPSLPTERYTGGNIREKPLAKILAAPELTLNMHGGTPEGTAHLWGYCKTCRFAEICRGGSSWSSHVFFDRRGNYPYCHHRVLDLKSHGRRERIVPKLHAIGKPFDCGVMELIEEPYDTPWPEGDANRFGPEKVVWGDSWHDWPYPEESEPIRGWTELFAATSEEP